MLKNIFPRSEVGNLLLLGAKTADSILTEEGFFFPRRLPNAVYSQHRAVGLLFDLFDAAKP